MFFANSAEKALEILGNNEIAVVVTDLKMPNINGVEFLKILADRYPDIVKIVLSGYFEISTILAAIKSGQVFQFLTKPWKFDEELIPAIINGINKYLLVNQKKYLELELDKLKSDLLRVTENHNKELERIKAVFIKVRSYVDSTNSILGNIIRHQQNEKLVLIYEDGLKLQLILKKILEG